MLGGSEDAVYDGFDALVSTHGEDTLVTLTADGGSARSGTVTV
jgi:hypothetical protein